MHLIFLTRLLPFFPPGLFPPPPPPTDGILYETWPLFYIVVPVSNLYIMISLALSLFALILCLQEFFENPSFRADGLKIYPTLVIRGTGNENM